MRQRMPPAWIGFANCIIDTEPGGASLNGAGGDRGLQQVFLFGEFHAGAQDLIDGRCAEDHAFATAFV